MVYIIKMFLVSVLMFVGVYAILGILFELDIVRYAKICTTIIVLIMTSIIITSILNMSGII